MNKVLKTPFIKNTMTKIKITSFTVTSCHIIPFECGTIYVNFIDEIEIIYPRSFILSGDDIILIFVIVFLINGVFNTLFILYIYNYNFIFHFIYICISYNNNNE